MLLCGAESLRDVVAFPKIKDASELMSDCPSVVDEKQLGELSLNIKVEVLPWRYLHEKKRFIKETTE